MSRRFLAHAAILAAALLTTLLCVSAAVALGGSRATTPTCYVLGHQWGGMGEDPGQFGGVSPPAGGPAGILVDRDAYTVFVTDPGNERVQIFGSEGTFQREIARRDEFGNPAWSIAAPIAEDVQGNLYIVTEKVVSVTVPWWPGSAQTTAYTVRKIAPASPQTDLLTLEVPLVYDYSRQNEPIIRNLVLGVTVDAHGNVYVADAGANRIVRFDYTGAVTAVWAKSDHFPGAGPGEFNSRAGVACDQTGHVFVLDANNERVQKMNALTGAFISQWGKPGIAPGSFQTGMAIDCDLQGNVYVAEAADIQKFTGAGAFITRWGSLNTGSKPNQLDDATGISVSRTGHVFVADCFNFAVKDFKPFVDSTGPRTVATQNITTSKGGKVVFTFTVTDAHSMDSFVTIKIKKGTRVVKKIGAFWKLADSKANYWPWTCTLGKGKYRWYVYAKDLSGNPQRTPIGNKAFTVR